LPEATTLAEILRGDLCRRAAILSDLDGCLVSGDMLLPDVPELHALCGERLWVVSNNSGDTAMTLAARLARLGVPLPPDRILLAGEQSLRHLARRHPGARIAVYAAEHLRALACELGLVLDRERPDLALLARDPGFGFADLAALAALMHRGVPLWLTNADASHPGPNGTPQPETGALFAALAAMVPGLEPQCLGKPAPDLALAALEQAGVNPQDAVFLGDTPATDGVAAGKAGIDFVLLHPPGAPSQVTGAATWPG